MSNEFFNLRVRYHFIRSMLVLKPPKNLQGRYLLFVPENLKTVRHSGGATSKTPNIPQ